MIKSIERSVEVPVKVLFKEEIYLGLNRQQQFEKAILEGYKYNILTGHFRKEIKDD